MSKIYGTNHSQIILILIRRLNLVFSEVQEHWGQETIERTLSRIHISMKRYPVWAINPSATSGRGISLTFDSDIVCFDGPSSTSSMVLLSPIIHSSSTLSSTTIVFSNSYFFTWWSFSPLISAMSFLTEFSSTFHHDLNTLLPPGNVQVTVKQFHRCWIEQDFCSY